MANIGEQLLQPESGWKRILYNNKYINYDGEFTDTGSNKMTNADSNISFKFKSDKLRLLLSNVNSLSLGSCVIFLDGIYYPITLSDYNINISKIIIFEIEELDPNKEHVIFINFKSDYYGLDAIDINENGKLLYKDNVSILTKLYNKPSYVLYADYYNNNDLKLISTSTYDPTHTPDLTYSYSGTSDEPGHVSCLFNSRTFYRWFMYSNAGGYGIVKRNKKMKVSYYGLITTGERYVSFSRMPKDWKLFGSNDGTNWDELDSRSYDFVANLAKVYSVDNCIGVFFKCDKINEYNQIKFQWYTNCGNGQFQMGSLLLFEDIGIKYLIKNNDKYISKFDEGGNELLNKLIENETAPFQLDNELSNKIKDIKENYRIIKIKK